MSDNKKMYENIGIINIGARDIQIKENEVSINKLNELLTVDTKYEKCIKIKYDNTDKRMTAGITNFKLFTEFIVNNFEDTKEYIGVPILRETLKCINETLIKKNQKLNNIILILTNQSQNDNEDVNKENSKRCDQDTIYVYNILEKLQNDSSFTDVDISKINFSKHIICGNPSDYDTMIKEYDTIIDNININNPECNTIYASITAGTPAMKTALIYSLSMKYDGEIVPIYNSYEKGIKPKVIDTVEEFRRRKIKDNVKKFVLRNDYVTAKALLNYNINKFDAEKEKVLTKCLEGLSNRIEFNFEKAEESIIEVIDYIEGKKSTYDDLIHTCKCFTQIISYITNKTSSNDDITNPNTIYLINEVKNNAIYKYSLGEFTDFLGRIFRIVEVVYLIILDKRKLLVKSGNKIKFVSKNLSQDKEDLLNNVKGYNAKIGKKVDTQLMNEVCLALQSNSIDPNLSLNSNEKNIVKQIDKFNVLKQKRNKSILAHGFEGISKDDIDKIVPNVIDELQELSRLVSNEFGNVIDDNFYLQGIENPYNKCLVELLEEL